MKISCYKDQIVELPSVKKYFEYRGLKLALHRPISVSKLKEGIVELSNERGGGGWIVTEYRTGLQVTCSETMQGAINNAKYQFDEYAKHIGFETCEKILIDRVILNK